MKINELQDGMKRVAVTVKVIDKDNIREVQSKFKDETYKVADAIVKDETGTIKMTLWNEDIDKVNVGDALSIENAYITAFKNEKQLNVGKYGKMTKCIVS